MYPLAVADARTERCSHTHAHARMHACAQPHPVRRLIPPTAHQWTGFALTPQHIRAASAPSRSHPPCTPWSTSSTHAHAHVHAHAHAHPASLQPSKPGVYQACSADSQRNVQASQREPKHLHPQAAAQHPPPLPCGSGRLPAPASSNPTHCPIVGWVRLTQHHSSASAPTRGPHCARLGLQVAHNPGCLLLPCSRTKDSPP